MTEQDDLLTEIQNLKTSNRKIRWVGTVCGICLAALIIFVRVENRKTSVANEFLLKDSTGAITARLTNDTHGPCLLLLSKDNSAQASLCVDQSNGSSLDLSADHGDSKAFLSPGTYIYEGGRLDPGVVVTRKGDFVSATLSDTSQLRIVHGASSIELNAPAGKPTINLVGNDGKAISKTP